jgi:hypothetical protein
MIKTLKILKINLSFVFRHKWDKKSKERMDMTFRDYRIGFWFRKRQIVGSNNFKNVNKWSSNLVNSYTVGADLFIAKFWISFDFNGMHLNVC